MNGASDLMVAVLGDKGRHARTTVGVAVLPADAAVEVEGVRGRLIPAMAGLDWLTARPVAHWVCMMLKGIIENTPSAFEAAIATAAASNATCRSAPTARPVHHDEALGRLTKAAAGSTP
jgi:hypothetical protein